MGKKSIKQMECVIVMLLICMNSAYEKKNDLGEKSIEPHVFYKNYPVLLFDTYGSQDEMDDGVSETETDFKRLKKKICC